MRKTLSLVAPLSLLAASGCFTHVYGATAGSRFGFSVASLGQLDNDAYADYVVGAPRDSSTGNTAGAVFAYLGSSTELKVDPAPGGVHFVATGVDNNEQAGFAIASGDFDGDGNPDLAIGAPKKPDASGASLGAVYLVSGEHVRSGGTFSLADAECVIMGTSVGGEMGWSVATGDINGDGFVDLVAGAPGTDAHRGAVHAFYTSPDVFKNCPEVASADFSNTATQAGRLGHAVHLADIDEDGMSDLLAGAPYRDQSRGRVIAFTTGGLGLEWSGAAVGDRAGWSLGSVDVDGDSVLDVAIGAPHADSSANGAALADAGAAYIIFASSASSGSLGSGAVVDSVVLGANAGDRLGWALSRLGSFSATYDENLVVGAPRADFGGADAGSAYILSRANLQALAFPGQSVSGLARLDGSQPGGNLGFAVAGLDDIDASGATDGMVGSPYTASGEVLLGAL